MQISPQTIGELQLQAPLDHTNLATVTSVTLAVTLTKDVAFI